MTAGPGAEPGPLWWKARAPGTVSSQSTGRSVGLVVYPPNNLCSFGIDQETLVERPGGCSFMKLLQGSDI